MRNFKKRAKETGCFTAEQYGLQEGKTTLSAAERVTKLAKLTQAAKRQRNGALFLLLKNEMFLTQQTANICNITRTLREQNISKYLRRVIALSDKFR